MQWCRESARGWWNGSGAGLPSAAPTLTRLYSLHYLFPFLIAGVVVLHIWALHIPGNNNPTGIDVKSPRETIPFHPYYTIKDGFALALFALFFACFVFYAPNLLSHPDNYIPANPLQTPAHIVPEWYFLPFYAILRAIPSKLFGVAALIGSIAILFFVPWLDTSRVRSTSYRPIYKWFFWAFVLTCIALGSGAAPHSIVPARAAALKATATALRLRLGQITMTTPSSRCVLRRVLNSPPRTERFTLPRRTRANVVNQLGGRCDADITMRLRQPGASPPARIRHGRRRA